MKICVTSGRHGNLDGILEEMKSYQSIDLLIIVGKIKPLGRCDMSEWMHDKLFPFVKECNCDVVIRLGKHDVYLREQANGLAYLAYEDTPKNLHFLLDKELMINGNRILVAPLTEQPTDMASGEHEVYILKGRRCTTKESCHRQSILP